MLPDSLRTALGTVIAQCRREWRSEAELLGAQSREVIAQSREVVAEFRARIVELDGSLREQVAARLALVRDGPNGAPGRDGLDGQDGASGRDGVDGAPGRNGVDGKDGEPGRDGVDGKDGASGRDGIDGTPGRDGAPGRNGTDGEPGRDGIDGTGGLPGRDGVPGLDGRDGQDGAPGLNGIDGVPGRNGIDGKDGSAGQDGTDGLDGTDGAPGQDGAPGRDGVDGKDGAPGCDGADGAPGRDGMDGAPGHLPVCEAWAPGVHYEAEVRTFDGGTWQALCDTAETPGAGADWLRLAAAGRDGASPRFVGTYAPGTAYRKLDVVALNSGSFAALDDEPGECPGPGWQLVAGPGRRGVPGEPGKRGEPGPPGPGIVSWRVDAERYAVTPVLIDGSTGAALDLRDLFEQFRAEMGV